jgi:acyl-CoA thioester hydrolase
MAEREQSAAELREVARVRVIYGDTDQMGMVYYGNYLRAFEEAHGLLLPVVEATVRYRRPARYDDELAIFAAISEVGGASARFVYAIRRVADGELLVEGHTVHACIDAAGKVSRMPAAFRAALSGSAPPPPPARSSGT